MSTSSIGAGTESLMATAEQIAQDKDAAFQAQMSYEDYQDYMVNERVLMATPA